MAKDEIMNSLELLREFVGLYGPPQLEAPVRDAFITHAELLGHQPRIDAKGNVLIGPEAPLVVVTAHLDEIALMVSEVRADGAVKVVPLGGAYPWKWGEGPVDLLGRHATVPGILSFGSTHTDSPQSVAQQAREGPLKWMHAFVFTGRPGDDLSAAGVRIGTRCVLSHSRRVITELGQHVGSYFLDDRADLVALLQVIEQLSDPQMNKQVLFAATAAEELGGDGAMWLLQATPAPIVVALEIGPITPECPMPLDANPTAWVKDSYSTTDPRDLDLLEDCALTIGCKLHWQAVGRGGSDATCAAAKGLCARPVTLAFPVENSHGYEIMHRDAIDHLARLTVEYLKRVV